MPRNGYRPKSDSVRHGRREALSYTTKAGITPIHPPGLTDNLGAFLGAYERDADAGTAVRQPARRQASDRRRPKVTSELLLAFRLSGHQLKRPLYDSSRPPRQVAI
jgi:hypothetical protein